MAQSISDNIPRDTTPIIETKSSKKRGVLLSVSNQEKETDNRNQARNEKKRIGRVEGAQLLTLHFMIKKGEERRKPSFLPSFPGFLVLR